MFLAQFVPCSEVTERSFAAPLSLPSEEHDMAGRKIQSMDFQGVILHC